MRASRRSALALALVAALAASPAFAEDVEAARQHFADGVRRFTEGDFEGARRLFLQAESEHHAPAILYNLARSEERLGHPQAAVDAYERYLAEAGTRSEYGEASAVALVDIRARSSRVHIDSNPPGARVFVDGAPVGVTPTIVLAPAGAHHVVAEGDSWRAVGDFEAAAGGEKAVLLERPPFALIPGAPVVAAGPSRAAGETGAAPAPEHHTSWLSPPATLWPLLGFGVVAVAGVVTSVVYAMKVNTDQTAVAGTESQIDTSTNNALACQTAPTGSAAILCRTLQSQQNAVNFDNTMIVVGGVVTGAGALGGLLYYFIAPAKPQGHAALRPAVTPWMSAGSTGLSLSGRF
jgi:hypothetical protein